MTPLPHELETAGYNLAVLEDYDFCLSANLLLPSLKHYPGKRGDNNFRAGRNMVEACNYEMESHQQ